MAHFTGDFPEPVQVTQRNSSSQVQLAGTTTMALGTTLPFHVSGFHVPRWQNPSPGMTGLTVSAMSRLLIT